MSFEDKQTNKTEQVSSLLEFTPWLDQFKTKSLESKYRLWSLKADVSLMNIIILVSLVAMVTFLAIDLFITVEHLYLNYLIAFRIVLLVIVLTLYFNKQYTKNVLLFDRSFTILLVMIIFQSLFTDFLRPPDYFTHIGMEISIIFVTYLAVPSALQYRISTNVVFSILLLILLFTLKDPQYLNIYASYSSSILLANIIGYTIALRTGRSRREHYLALINERAALGEVKTLKGIIPICGYCKNIRDDKGSWDVLENYMSKHSDATFSHGICPDCIPKIREEHHSNK